MKVVLGDVPIRKGHSRIVVVVRMDQLVSSYSRLGHFDDDESVK